MSTSPNNKEVPKSKNFIFGLTLFSMVSSVYGYTIWSMQKGVNDDLQALDDDDGGDETMKN